ncbi:multidrug resistance-associated ABC transporter [Mycena epipterygia]|nr:multidrug resistance-associated ABC transporter [Mycena epipterygia]
MDLCNGSHVFDLEDPCVRGLWSATVPAFVVFALFILFVLRHLLPSSIRRIFASMTTPFNAYMTLEEAQALDSGATGRLLDPNDYGVEVQIPRRRYSLFFAFCGLLQALAWGAHALWSLMGRNAIDKSRGTQDLLIAVSWLYTAISPVLHPSATVPYDLLTIYLLHGAGGVLMLGGYIFDHTVEGIILPSGFILVGLSANIGVTFSLLYVAIRRPLRVLPQHMGIGNSISSEDYTSFWGALTFSWIYPLIQLGGNSTLNEADVSPLSPNLQSRPVFLKFISLQHATLLRRIIATAYQDLIFDFLWTLCSILFGYSRPFFLKPLLDSIGHPTTTKRDQGIAFMFAVVILVCSVLQAEATAQHLSWCRRAATRVRSELMVSIYEKALKRKVTNGVVNREKMEGQKLEPPTSAPTPSVSGAATPYSKGSLQKPKSQVEQKHKLSLSDAGKIVNLMSGDCTRVSGLITMLYAIYGAPFEIVLGSLLLYQLLGWSAFTGFLVVVLGWPVNKYLMERNVRLRKATLKAWDRRVGVLDELISSIKFVKFFAWEDRWMKRTMDARGEELDWLAKGVFGQSSRSSLWSTSPVALSLISLFTYVSLGNQLTVGTAFAVRIRSAFSLAPLTSIPMSLVQVVQARVALDRIAAYLSEDEVSAQVSSLKTDSSTADPGRAKYEGLGIDNASFKWNESTQGPAGLAGKDSTLSTTLGVGDSILDVREGESEIQDQHFELRNISVKFPEKRLSVITGPTASGKTALLMALLGEMTMLRGGRIIMAKDDSVDEDGNIRGIAYAAQTPYLRSQSIRENILFGSPHNDSRYRAVIECCALRPDLDLLEDGDSTQIGSKGVTLSGGQKARVALARAVYSRKKYVLLDDPLSAVDSHTARHIYQHCLRGPLLENRTVILVTHHVKLVLPGAEYFVQMEDGRITVQGTAADLRAQGVLDRVPRNLGVGEEKHKKSMEAAQALVGGLISEQVKEPRKLVQEEHRETGSVKFSVYKMYLAAGGYGTWALLAMITLALQSRSLAERVWIKIWTSAYTPDTTAPMSLTAWPSAAEHPMFYVGVYAGIGLFGIAMSLTNVALIFTAAIKAAQVLFSKLLITVVRATFRFHDTTPQGRMMNRFSKDFETIDLNLAFSLQGVNNALADFLVSLCTVVYVFPLFLFPALIIGYFYRFLAIGYLNTGRDLRRMESNTRSPIFSEFGELLTGIVTVRAFSAEKRFLDNLYPKIDETSKIGYAFWMTNRWLSFNFDVLASISVFITALFAITFLHNDAGLAGVVISSALAFGDSVYQACRNWTNLELDLNAVERIIEYLDLPQEPPAVIESRRPPAYWPSSSKNDALLVVKDLVVKYAPELPPILQGISFRLKAGERVGLVGRTGSGKSTLAMSLLRFVDPSSGKIVIDGIDISTIGTYDLRSRITFIPQDATLFSGSLRENLDPFGDYDDVQCTDVLRRAQLIPATRSLNPAPLPLRSHSPLGFEEIDTSSITIALNPTTLSLDTPVTAGGTNFSQGQRQLIAIARAMLRHSAIVILDEATSSVDFSTDTQIQKVIREEFRGSMLITVVAHRLRTIIDYDRLIILDKGKVVEFDTPLQLIRTEGGIFRNMCLKSGYFGELEMTAKAKEDADGSPS